MTLREWLPLIGMAVCAFVFNSSEFMPVALLTGIAESFGVDEAAAGMLITVYAWAVMVLSLPLMIAASRIDFRRLLLIVLAVFIAGQAFSALAASYWTLMAARLVVACAHAVFWSIATPIAVRLVPEERRSLALSIVVMGSAVSMILGLPLGRVLGLALGWRMTFACIAALSLLALIYLAVVLPRMESGGPFRVGELPGLFKNPALRGMYVLTVLIVLGYYTCYSYIEPFLLQQAHISEGSVTLVLSGLGVASLVGSVLFSKFYLRLRFYFLPGVIGALAVLLLLMRPAAGAVVATITVCLCVGLFAALMNVSTEYEVIWASDPHEQAVAVSIYSGLYNLGIGGGSAIGGAVCTYLSVGEVGLVGGILAAVAFAYCAFILVPRLKRGR